MSWFQRRPPPPDVHFWQIVKYSFLCNAPSGSRPTKIKLVKQTARSPRGVISAAVDGCSAADTPVNHGRNSLKRPRKKKNNQKKMSRLTQLPAVRRERSLTFCISPRQRQIVEQRPQARTLLSLAQTYGNHEHSHRRDHARKCSMAHFHSKNILTHSERLVPCKFIRFLRSWSVAHGDTISWDCLNPTNENSQPKTTSSVCVASWLYNMFIWCINAGQDAEFCGNQNLNQPSSLTPSWSMWPTSCYCLKWQIRGAIRLIMFGEEKGVKFVSFCFSSTLGPSQVLR